MSNSDVLKIPGLSALIDRLESLLSRAGDRTRTSAVLFKVLNEAISQAEDKAPIGTLPTIQRLRDEIGVARGTRALSDSDADISERVSRIEELLKELHGTGKLPLNESPPTAPAKKKRSAKRRAA